MMIFLISYILVLHFIADFVFQSNYVAQNKSKSNKVLLHHVGYYFNIFFIGLLSYIMLFFSQNNKYFYLLDDILIFIVVNVALHFITDYFTSRISSYFWNKPDIHQFFVTIGADQLVHQLSLIVTTVYLLKELVK